MAPSIRWMTAGMALAAAIGLVEMASVPSAHADGPRLFGRGGFRLFPGRWPPAVVPGIEPDRSPIVPLKPSVDVTPVVPLTPSEKGSKEFVVNKDLRINVQNVATLLKDGHPIAARNLAVTVARKIEEFNDLEQLYRQRNKEGMGWGSTPLKNPTHDGLEMGLRYLANQMPVKRVAQQASDVEAAYWLEAMAELTMAKPPTTNSPKKTKQMWNDRAEQLRFESIQFRKAAITLDAIDMRATAGRINAVCNGCHVIFKDS